jgi:hypothetical protein
MGSILLVLMAVGMGAFVLYILHMSERYRADAIRAFAVRSGMHYIGDAIPKSLTLQGTPFYYASKVWNVIDGEPHGTRIMAFDCQVGVGKQSWRRTVIAVEGDGDAFRGMPLRPDMAIDRPGRWTILYRTQASTFSLRLVGLTPVEELEANLNAVIIGSAKASR